jgi:hypothetical protein
VIGLPDGIFSNYKNPYLGKFWWVWQWKMLGYFIAIWPFYGHLVYFVAMLVYFVAILVYFVVIWYIFPVLVYCAKKTLATLST